MLRRAFLRLVLLLFGTAGIARKLGAIDGQKRPEGVEKYRPCNGSCCHKAPLRAIPDRKGGREECFFHDHSMQFDVNSGCQLMADEKLLRTLSKKELVQFAVACVGYPHLYGPYTLGETGEKVCCWRNRS